ncbi:CAAX amino terminal protease family protein [Planococcus antarcticus DSM 14505]|uniref:CAAX amino terminal protease family protein n=1 Tax=Planococcus antarcticus DSM 14505 TaxID=1185653 RepID=A0AA87IPP6_9BACL|nr:type II CAAX endopeptidase family protein [Planococcus antarcticus]EIM07987.1 CAAX amino terminal protease family protein [Planococcus antarcticus DSM 14505]
MFEQMKARYLILLSILGAILTMVALIVLDVSDMTFDVISQLVLYVLVPGIYFGYYFRKHNASVWNVLSFNGIQKWMPTLLALVVVSIAFSLSMFWFQLFMLAPVAPWLVDFMLEALPIPDTPLYIVFTVFTIAMLAPVVEEFMFRGVLLKRMIGKTSVWGGILISSLLFGILHLDVIGAFLFGIVASLLYLRTNNLLVPILLHIINNSLAAVAMFLAPTWPESIAIFNLADVYAKAAPNAVMLGISALLLISAIFWLARGLQTQKQPEKDSIVE